MVHSTTQTTIDWIRCLRLSVLQNLQCCFMTPLPLTNALSKIKRGGNSLTDHTITTVFKSFDMLWQLFCHAYKLRPYRCWNKDITAPMAQKKMLDMPHCVQVIGLISTIETFMIKLIAIEFTDNFFSFNSSPAISQTTFSNAFSWLKMLEFRLKICS